MKIISKPCGIYQTNCYIITKNSQELIIDAGQNSAEFVMANSHSPLAILNTHGHFDHIFSSNILKSFFNIDVYIHKDDEFMLKHDIFGAGYEFVEDAVCVGEAKFKDIKFNIGEFEIEFLHFPGHTPGCSMIRVDDVIFSGDFLFKGSIGRYDFPYSDPSDMKASLQKCLKMSGEFTLYPGHGEPTTLKTEQANLGFWLDRLG